MGDVVTINSGTKESIWNTGPLKRAPKGRDPIFKGFQVYNVVPPSYKLAYKPNFNYRCAHCRPYLYIRSYTSCKTSSRHSCGPAVFASSQHGPCIKSTTLTGFLFSLWKTIIHFRWYLHDFEAMNSQFFPCLASMCNTRVWKKPDFFVSARGGQVSQLLQRVCVAPVCATNKRKHVVSDGSIHISSELMLVAQLLGCTIYHHLPRDQGKNKF